MNPRVLQPLVVLLLALAACSGSESGPTGPDPTTVVASVSINPSSATIEVGQTQAFAVTVLSEAGTAISNRAPAFSSNNGSAATVTSGGIATGHAEGSAQITATLNGFTATAILTVVDTRPPTAPSQPSVSFTSGTTATLSWTDNAVNEDGYRLESRNGSGIYVPFGTTPANATSANLTGLIPSLSYDIRVVAFNQNGDAPGPAVIFTVPVTVTIVTTSLADALTNVVYSQTLSATGGGGAITWSVSSGALPPGLTLSTVGVLSGTPIAQGSFNFTIRASSGGLTAERNFTINVGVFAPTPGFDIEIEYTTSVSAQDRAIIESAVARLESIIIGDIPDFPQAFSCADRTVPAVDDIKLFVGVESIDGEFGTLAQAGACNARALGNVVGLPLAGRVTFDSDDFARLRANGTLASVMIHEIVHTLGFARFWWDLYLLRSGDCLIDPRFIGGAGSAEFQALGGIGAVPLENDGALDDGSNCSHIDEQVFGNALMTPSINPAPNPFTRVSIGMLQDMGYNVSFAQADPYPGPSPSPGADSASEVIVEDLLGLTHVVLDDGTELTWDEFTRRQR